MRWLTSLVLVGAVAAAPAAPAAAQDKKVDLSVAPFPKHVDERTHKAIEAGIKWLASKQGSDGSWRGNANAYGGDFPVAMTAVAALAFLAHGDTPDRGTYAPNVKLALNYLLRCKVENGMLTSPGEAGRPMYGHCFAMLFLAEVYGMESDERIAENIRRRLEDGVKLICRGQSNRGGWYYTPESGQQGQDEGSVTVTAVQALRAAKNAGIPIPVPAKAGEKTVIERGIQYILDCQSPFDGGIRYSFTHRGESRPAITAAAVATLYNAGVYAKNEKELEDSQKRGEISEAERRSLVGVRRCLQYCDETFSGRVDPGLVQGFMFYTHLYLSQAMWMSFDPDWKKLGKDNGYWRWDRYYPDIRKWLLDDPQSKRDRQGVGSWIGDEPGPGEIYGTAVALMVLQIPYQYLPILQR